MPTQRLRVMLNLAMVMLDGHRPDPRLGDLFATRRTDRSSQALAGTVLHHMAAPGQSGSDI